MIHLHHSACLFIVASMLAPVAWLLPTLPQLQEKKEEGCITRGVKAQRVVDLQVQPDRMIQEIGKRATRQPAAREKSVFRGSAWVYHSAAAAAIARRLETFSSVWQRPLPRAGPPGSIGK